MSPDDRDRPQPDDPTTSDDTTMHAPEIDEGLIHEWLDGQCDADTAARLEALVRTSPAFAAQVAEARGLLAASSRILGALDDVPAQVLPGASATAAPPAAPPARAAARAVPPVRGPSRTLQRLSAIAAVLAVAATGTWMLQQQTVAPVPTEQTVAVSDALAAPSAEGAGTSPMSSATPMVTEAAAANEAAAASTGAAPLPPAAPTASPAAPPTRERVDPRVAASSEAERRVAERVVAEPRRADAVAQKATAADVAPSEARGVRGGIAAGVEAGRAAPSVAPAAASPLAATPQRLSALVATGADGGAPASVPDIPDTELAFDVQRVSCTPECVQRREAIATDGRVVRHRGALGRSTDGTRGRVSADVVARLGALADSLSLHTLPPTLGLDGRHCRTVGSLRESLRVRFRHDGALRSVMGLPWCSDGTHPLDIVARAIEVAADSSRLRPRE